MMISTKIMITSLLVTLGSILWIRYGPTGRRQWLEAALALVMVIGIIVLFCSALVTVWSL